ncbi:hypothetical protein PENTCL1PPCAC_12467, partial [Pristionchus entomophagus]
QMLQSGTRKRYHSEGSNGESPVKKREANEEEGGDNEIKEGGQGAIKSQEADLEAVHVIEIGNGEKVLIKFFFDSETIAIDDIKIVTNLNDLSFLFTRDTSDSNYDASLPTKFRVFFEGKELYLIDGNSSTARLRIGPFLAHHLGSHAVVNQGNCIPAQVPLHTMRVFLFSGERDHYESVNMDVKGFTLDCGSRGIISSSEHRKYHIPTEIAALFSDYFYNIFYNDRFKESREKFVEIKDVEIDILIIILADSVFGSGRWIPSWDGTTINWET